MMTISSLVKYS